MLAENKVISIITAFLLILSSQVLAGNLISDNNFSLDDDEDEYEEIIIDNREEDTGSPQGKEDNRSPFIIPVLQKFLYKSRFTFRHEFVSRIDRPDRIFINRSSLRFQWEDLLFSSYYLLFDGKLSYNFAYNYLDYPSDVERYYRFQKQIHEFYLQKDFGKASLKFGRQILVWGEADIAVVTDVINPRDLTEFIFIPIEDARIGLLMLTADYYSENSHWTLFINPDPKVNRFARPGHEYEYPFIYSQPGIVQVRNENRPAISLSNTEIGMRLAKTIEQSDISIMAAYIIDDNPVFRTEWINRQGELILQPEYRPYYMMGAAANLSRGNFLWKGEAAIKINRTFTNSARFTDDGLIKRSSFDTVVGLDYDASGAYAVTLEISNQHILNWTEDISGIRRDESILYLTWSKNLLNDILKPIYVYLYQIQDHEALHRFRIEYQITDQWSCIFETAYFNAWKEDSYLGYLQDQSRISFEIRYNF
ncbi:MAG: DUF1302 family protein [Nitrospirota bacterium]